MTLNQRSTPTADGILAVWNDCRPGDEAAYEDWYLGEHLIERVSVPGFHTGQRFMSDTAAPRYFTYYEVDNPAVLASPAYLDRLDAPTPLTTRIMTGTFINMTRTVCRRILVTGSIRGSHIAVARFYDGIAPSHLIDAAPALILHPGTTRVEVWLADQPDRERLSREESLRGPDKVIAACILVHTTTRGDTDAAEERLRRRFTEPSAIIATYHLMNHLDRRDLSLSETCGGTP